VAGCCCCCCAVADDGLLCCLALGLRLGAGDRTRFWAGAGAAVSAGFAAGLDADAGFFCVALADAADVDAVGGAAVFAAGFAARCSGFGAGAGAAEAVTFFGASFVGGDELAEEDLSNEPDDARDDDDDDDEEELLLLMLLLRLLLILLCALRFVSLDVLSWRVGVCFR
jgi:hypothetical protein